MFVDLCNISQAGAVGQAPGPNFGQTLTKNQDKIKYIILPIGPLLAPIGPNGHLECSHPTMLQLWVGLCGWTRTEVEDVVGGGLLNSCAIAPAHKVPA